MKNKIVKATLGLLIIMAIGIIGYSGYTLIRFNQNPVEHYIVTTVEKQILTEQTVLNDYIASSAREIYNDAVNEGTVQELTKTIVTETSL